MSESVVFFSHSETQTQQLAECLGGLVQPGQVIALVGPLGAGKTRFAQGFGVGAGVSAEEVINSPTFTFINEYQGRVHICHVDVYRLDSMLEAETLGLEDYFYNDSVCLVEWADRIEAILPVERLEIALSYLSETERQLTISAFGRAYQELLSAMQQQLAEAGEPSL